MCGKTDTEVHRGSPYHPFSHSCGVGDLLRTVGWERVLYQSFRMERQEAQGSGDLGASRVHHVSGPGFPPGISSEGKRLGSRAPVRNLQSCILQLRYGLAKPANSNEGQEITTTAASPAHTGSRYFWVFSFSLL